MKPLLQPTLCLALLFAGCSSPQAPAPAAPETPGVGKIVRLDFGQTRRTNFRQPRGFVEREPACDTRILKFLAQAFDCHTGFRRLYGGIEID